MTANNEVKAARPCTLWGQTFDSNTVKEVNAIYDHVYLLLHGKMIDSLYVETRQDVPRILFEAIQAIASAQRPWLKAEGFEFEEGTVYEVLTERTAEDGSIYHARNTVYYHAGNSTLISCYDNGTHKNDGYTGKSAFCCYSKDVLAFKPISDSQEAWDAVAGVEVAEGV
jgi:hypothetical protein